VNIVNGDIPYTEAKSLPSNYLVRHNSSSDIRHDGTIEKTVNTDQHTRDRKQMEQQITINAKITMITP